MAKYCANCGNELESGVKFCNKCGSPIEEKEGQTIINNIYNNTSTKAPVLTKREIVLAIILSIITCGIYSIYWFITMTDDANKVSGDGRTSGIAAFLFTLITCGIYSFYWNYQMGKKLYQAGSQHGKDIQDNATLYLVLSVLGLSIVNYCLIQTDLNKFAE